MTTNMRKLMRTTTTVVICKMDLMMAINNNEGCCARLVVKERMVRWFEFSKCTVIVGTYAEHFRMSKGEM